MNGFERVYGDSKVKKQVFQMLEDEYRKITVNPGIYTPRECSEQLEYGNKIPENLERYGNASPKNIAEAFPFEPYRGQDSTVLNVIDQRLDEEQVNSYKASELARNDLLLYQAIKDTETAEFMPETLAVEEKTEKNRQTTRTDFEE